MLPTVFAVQYHIIQWPVAAHKALGTQGPSGELNKIQGIYTTYIHICIYYILPNMSQSATQYTQSNFETITHFDDICCDIDPISALSQ